MYFNKSAKDVNLEEAATLAAIIQTPARLSPFVDPRAQPQATQLRAAPDGRRGLHHRRPTPTRSANSDRSCCKGQPIPDQSIAPYFAEEIRKKLEAQYRRLRSVRSRPHRADDARRESAGGRESRTRSRPAAARQASFAAIAARCATSSPTASSSRASPPTAGRSRFVPATSSRRWSRRCRRRPPGRCGSASATREAELSPKGSGLDAKDAVGTVQGRRRHRGRSADDRQDRRVPRPRRSNSRRPSRAPSWPSTIGPDRFARWSAASASPAASSTAPRRPTGRSARSSSRSSTPRPSIAATRPPRSSWTNRCPIRPVPNSRRMRR